MGYRLGMVISSPVPRELRAAIMAAAISHWPFCRGPRDTTAYSERVVFAPPELTSYLLDSDEEEEWAHAQVHEVKTGLTEWSRLFPLVTFVCVEADCFGGSCEYVGFCCKAGEQLLAQNGEMGGSLVKLVGCVGIELTSVFEPFVRGFFAGRGSGGFV